jgi:hypothetical protein
MFGELFKTRLASPHPARKALVKYDFKVYLFEGAKC